MHRRPGTRLPAARALAAIFFLPFLSGFDITMLYVAAPVCQGGVVQIRKSPAAQAEAPLARCR